MHVISEKMPKVDLLEQNENTELVQVRHYNTPQSCQELPGVLTYL